jgi:DNA-binding LacI/PurR family transcriptional regulator
MNSPGTPHVTLHDVAARSGVSISTVSRALNGLSVRKGNLAKVRAAADELGYVANEAARSLRSVRTLTAGVVFYELNTTLGLELLEALAASVEDRGYSLFVSTARANEDRYELLMRRFLERRVDALFCVRPVGEGGVLELYEKAGVPVVALFSRDGAYRDLPLVAPTIEHAGHEALRRLKDLGHRGIALITPSRRVDYMRALRFLARDVGLEVHDYSRTEEGLDAVSFLDSLRSEPDFPTAVVARAVDAVMLLNACHSHGVRVPEQLSIVAVGDVSPIADGGPTPLSMIHLNAGKIGRVAAADMFERLAGFDVAHERLIENGTWVERASTGPAPLARTPSRQTRQVAGVTGRRSRKG